MTQVSFISQSYLNNDGAKLYLKFQPLYYTFKRLGYIEKVVSSKFKRFSTKNLTTLTTTDNTWIKWYENSNFYLIYKGSYSKQNFKKLHFYFYEYNKFFVVYELDTLSWDLNFDFTLKICLFWGVKLAKNIDSDKYVHSGCGDGFDLRWNFHYLTVAWV